MEEEGLPLELWLKIYNQRERKANKQLICDKLCAVLQLTNRFYDLESLEYRGRKRIRIACLCEVRAWKRYCRNFDGQQLGHDC